DFEPNTPHNRLVNVLITDCMSTGNAGSGLSMGLYSLTNQSPPVSVTIKRFTSRRNGHSGFFLSSHDDADAPAGSVVVADSSSTDDPDYGAVASFWTAPGPKLVVRNLTVTNANSSGKNYDNAAISIKRGGGGHLPLGNVTFLGTSIFDTKGRLQTYFS